MEKRNRTLTKNQNDKNIKNVIEALEKLANTSFVFGSNVFHEEFQNIIKRLKDDSFKLAVVGEFSSGKSTFLNALIGKDILKHGAKETTATITEIENNNISGDDVFDVYFENGEKEENIPIEQLIEYTSTSSKIHSVAQDISKVVIKSHIINTTQHICFVDTPGLNGVADNHREKTIEQVKNAHACIYLLQVRGLGQSDIDFLKFICKYQHNIIFVQNFIDELKSLEGETVEGKLAEQSKILSENVFENHSKIKYRLVGISARKALIARDLNISKYEGINLDEAIRNRLYEESRFDSVIDEISALMKNNEKERIQQRDTINVALELLNQLRDVVSFQNEQEKEEWNNSSEARRKRGYEKIKKELLKNKNEYLFNIANFVESESSDIRKLINKKIDQGLHQIETSANDVLNQITTINKFDKYMNENRLSQLLYEGILGIEDDCNKHMNIDFENLLCNAILRIKQYTVGNVRTTKVNEFKADEFHSDEKKLKKFVQQESDEIRSLEKELAEKKARLESDRNRRRDIASDARKLDTEIRSNAGKMTAIESQKRSEIARLGSKPEAETKYRPEEYEEYRGGFFGTIKDKVFGPKRKTRTVEYLDYSKQQQWLKKKSDVETKYRIGQNRIQAENRILNEKLKNINEELIRLDKMEPRRRDEITQVQSLLNSKIEYAEAKRKKAQAEYLRNLKRLLMDSVASYLYDNVQECLVSNFEIVVSQNQKQIHTITEKMFSISFEERISALNGLLESNNKQGNTIIKSDKLLETIVNTSKILEEYLC